MTITAAKSAFIGLMAHEYACLSDEARTAYAGYTPGETIQLAKEMARDSGKCYLFNDSYVKVARGFRASCIGILIAMAMERYASYQFDKQAAIQEERINILHNCAVVEELSPARVAFDPPATADDQILYYQHGVVNAWTAIKAHPVAVGVLRSFNPLLFDQQYAAPIVHSAPAAVGASS